MPEGYGPAAARFAKFRAGGEVDAGKALSIDLRSDETVVWVKGCEGMPVKQPAQSENGAVS